MISIIIPIKNEGKRLQLLLPTLVHQTYKNFEIVLNDDSTTNDNTAQIIKQFANKLKIRRIRNNPGMAAGRKIGAKIAKGEYMLHLDADMTLSPKVLENCMQKVKQGFDGLIIPEISHGEGFWADVRAFERSMYIGDDTVEAARFFSNKAYWAVGGHNENMVLSEDKDIDLRIREAGFKVGRIDYPIYHNEGKYDLWRSIEKKFFYGKTAAVFIVSHPKQAIMQGNLLFRPAYFRNWRKLATNPVLACNMFIMKFLEGFAGLLGLLFGRYLGFIDPWKKK